MAFKMNRAGFTFYTKPKGPTMKHTDQFGKPHPEKEEDDYINIRKNEPPTKQGKGPTKKENMGYPKYGKKHDGPSFNAELRKEAMDPNTTMNEGFKDKVLSSKGPTKKNMGYPKHSAGHTISDADKKRKEVLIEKLNKMSDPMDSNQGKATLKAIKKIDPNFDAETYM